MRTASEVLAALNAWFGTEPKLVSRWSENYTDHIGSMSSLVGHLEDGGEGNRFVDVPNLGRMHLVKQFGGEGLGDEAWAVFSLNGQHFKQYGWHRSHDGTYYEGEFREVRARQVMRTEWFDV